MSVRHSGKGWLALALAAAAILASCSPSDNNTDAKETGIPAPPAPSVHGEFEFEGAFSDSGTYEMTYNFSGQVLHTCRTIASADSKDFKVPLPTRGRDQRFRWTATIDPYKGPGNYDLADLDDAAIDVLEGANGDSIRYGSDEDSKVTVMVGSDNGGTMKFSSLRSPGDDELGGRVSWNCRNPNEG